MTDEAKMVPAEQVNALYEEIVQLRRENRILHSDLDVTDKLARELYRVLKGHHGDASWGTDDYDVIDLTERTLSLNGL